MALRNNITGTPDLTSTILSPGDGYNNIKVITITNTHASDSADVDLFIDNNTEGSFYIIKNLNMFYKYSCYFIDNIQLEEIISQSNNLSTFLLKLKQIIQLIYKKHIKKFKKNSNLYKVLNYKYKLI